jgi:hypothetical protein
MDFFHSFRGDHGGFAVYFSKGEFYPGFLNPSLEKRGRGDLWAQWRGKSCSEFLRTGH